MKVKYGRVHVLCAAPLIRKLAVQKRTHVPQHNDVTIDPCAAVAIKYDDANVVGVSDGIAGLASRVVRKGEVVARTIL